MEPAGLDRVRVMSFWDLWWSNTEFVETGGSAGHGVKLCGN